MTLRSILPPFVAVGLLVIVVTQTSSALRTSGTWRSAPRPTNHGVDPYASLERALSAPDTMPPVATLRDPFGFGRVAAPRAVVHHAAPLPTPPPVPVVTAIVTDADAAHAVLRYEGTNYSVKSGDLFAQYRVVSITLDAVVVDDGKERLVLRRPTKGD